MLVSLETLKEALKITETSEDAALLSVLERSEAVATRIMGRSVAAAEYEEILDGHGERTIILKNFPVLSVASLACLENGTWTTVDPSGYSVSKPTGEIRFPTSTVPR